MPQNTSPKELETKQNDFGKAFIVMEKRRKEKSRINKRLEGQLGKPEVKNLEMVKEGESTPCQEKFKSRVVDETSTLEVWKFF